MKCKHCGTKKKCETGICPNCAKFATKMQEHEEINNLLRGVKYSNLCDDPLLKDTMQKLSEEVIDANNLTD